LPLYTSSTRLITQSLLEIFATKANPRFTIRKITLGANNLLHPAEVPNDSCLTQADFFTNYAELERQSELMRQTLAKENRAQRAVLKIRRRYGKNAILSGANFEDGATMRQRHHQIGGHRA